jgi:predicted O-methyltransferase YrrM
MVNSIKRLLKHAVLRTPLARFALPRYIYNFRPAQLGFLIDCVDRTRDLGGPILEIGCFAGATTVWLNTHLQTSGIKKHYIALDTFEGFLSTDVDHEVLVREKPADTLGFEIAFGLNHISWVRRTLDFHGFTDVELVKTDAGTYDYSRFRDISFALVDVDLYLPVRRTLEAIWEHMADGGIIVVDDCAPANIYDGALQAYREFIAERSLPERIVHGKLGVIDVRRRS